MHFRNSKLFGSFFGNELTVAAKHHAANRLLVMKPRNSLGGILLNLVSNKNVSDILTVTRCIDSGPCFAAFFTINTYLLHQTNIAAANDVTVNSSANSQTCELFIARQLRKLPVSAVSKNRMRQWVS